MLVSLKIANYEDEDEFKGSPELEISLDSYSNTNIYLQTDESEFLEQYRNLVVNSQNILNVSINDNMDDLILNYGSNYVIGATFLKFEIIGWYNNEFFHSLPLSLNLINQAILKTFVGENYSITVTNKPYLDDPIFEHPHTNRYLIVNTIYGIMFITILILVSLISTIIVKERTSGMIFLQFNYGFNRLKYWLTSFLVDAFGFFVLTFLFIVLMDFVDADYEKIVFKITWGLMLTFLQFVCLIYLLSTMFRKSLNLKLFLVILNIVQCKYRSP